MAHKTTKRAVLTSALSLLLCCTMLIGTTWAWFTDSVTSAGNIIKSGTLDVEMYYKNITSDDWSSVEDTEAKFFVDANGDEILWEPGVMSYANFEVVNEGNLALKYNFTTNSTHNELETNSVAHNLEEVIKVKVVEGTVVPNRSDIENYTDWSPLESFASSGYLLPKGENGDKKLFTVILYWKPTASDNLYNVKNGAVVSDYDTTGNNYLWIDFGIKLIATQYTYEIDSFDETYDRYATYTQTSSNSAMINNEGDTYVTVGISAAPNNGDTKVDFPAGSFDNGSQEVVVDVQVDSLGVAADLYGFNVNNDKELACATITLTATVDGTKVESFNGQYVKVETYISKGLNNVEIEYRGDGEAARNVTYDSATGRLTFETNHFSEWVAWCEINAEDAEVKDYVYDESSRTVTVSTPLGLAWAMYMVNSNDETWNWFAGMTIKLDADIDLAGALWCPIGNYSTFDGNFDGQGHTVSNMRQNVYEQDAEYVGGDNATIKSGGFGLFGTVTGGTISNLTIDNFWIFSEGKTMGAVAGRASGGSSFDNITIKNCKLNGYQNGCAGIVGLAYNWSEGDNVLKFDNIVVDESNIFTTNYRSPDTCIGGLLGRLYGDYKGTLKAEISNCAVSAQIMALNDVVANYQWYRYRNSGMLIGRIEGVDPADESFNVFNYVTIGENVVVDYDNWNQQRYCEFHEAGTPAYSQEGEWKFFRIDEDDNGNHEATYVRENGTVVVSDMSKHYHYDDESHDVLLVFDQLIGGGTGCGCVREIEGVTVNYLNDSAPKD